MNLQAEIQKVMEAEKKQGYLDSGVVGGFGNWLTSIAAKLPADEQKPFIDVGLAYANASLLERPMLWQTCNEAFARVAALRLFPAELEPQAKNSHNASGLWVENELNQKAVANKKALQVSIQYLKGVGPKKALLLRKLGIFTVEDLLFYLPRDYELRGDIVKIKDLQIGEMATIKGRILIGSMVGINPKLSIFKVMLEDETGTINCVWFNQRHLQEQLTQGKKLIAFGKVERKYNQTELWVQDYQIVEGAYVQPAKILPIYPSTGNLTQKNIRAMIKLAWDKYGHLLMETLPKSLMDKHKLLDLQQALANLHFPTELKQADLGRKRLAYEELLILQMALLAGKIPDNSLGIARPKNQQILKDFLAQISFTLTGAQQRVITEIFADLESTKPMARLVQGDVGSGKTIIAAAALYKNAKAGYQGALMVPTEILAGQHYEALQPLFTRLGLKTGLLVGDTKIKERREILQQLASGELDVVIGTHTLFQKEVVFKNLALAVTDEQHRFGVMQRSSLVQKGIYADMLVMTATPIPRTLAMTLYGDLDVSVIDELPPGRQKIETYAVGYDKEARALNFVAKELDKGRQAYIVCPLVDESDKIELEAATVLAERLQQQELKKYVVGLLHGKMKPKEKDELMAGFAAGFIQVLVATTVIEVGINVPNATVMVIRDAERFGLAQLHQLRGRVGRGAEQSYCILMNNAKSAIARERMKTMSSTTDGFVIAEADLKLRGAGEVLGTRQHGIAEMKFANLLQDLQLLEVARVDAKELLRDDKYKALALSQQVDAKIKLLSS